MTLRKVLAALAVLLVIAALFFVFRGDAQVSIANGVSAIPVPTAGPASPSACASMSPVNGTAQTFMTSDSAPAICSNMSPTMTGNWAFTGTMTYQGNPVPQVLSGTTASIGGGLLIAGGCTSGTATVTGAQTGGWVWATPAVNPGAVTVIPVITSTNTVTVFVCALISLTPVSTTYTVKVLL